jgi:hypothetical protein
VYQIYRIVACNVKDCGFFSRNVLCYKHMKNKIIKKWYPIDKESGKIANFALFAVIGAVALFSLYVLMNTEKTIIVINEAAESEKEVFIAGMNPSEPERTIEEEQAAKIPPRVQILETGVGFLNVRDSGSAQGVKIGRVKPGEVYEYTEQKNDWYHLVGHEEFGEGWVSGQYVKEVDRSADLFGE